MDIISSTISAFQLVLAAAPKAIELYKKAKEFITAMFGAGLITVEQQDALHAHVDALQALALSGIVPSAWQVDPDPVTIAPPPVVPPIPPV